MRSSIEQNAWPPILTGRAATIMAMQHHLSKSQWWSADRLRDEQLRQLTTLADFATRNIPYYATRLRAAGIEPGTPLTWEAWARIPVLTRREVQSAGDALHAAQIPASHGRVGEVASGGSTGVPVRVNKSEFTNLMWEAINVREELWHREEHTGSMVVITGPPKHFTDAQKKAIKSSGGLTLPHWGGSQSQIWTTGPLHMIDRDQSADAHVAFILRHAPSYIFTYPVILRLILWHCRDRGITFPGLRAVWTRSETVDDALRPPCQHR